MIAISRRLLCVLATVCVTVLLPVGATAPQAAGVIHTDFQRGFIKAEVVAFADLVDAGSMAEAKARGKVRIEGKDYVMQDGDVVEFRFNV